MCGVGLGWGKNSKGGERIQKANKSKTKAKQKQNKQNKSKTKGCAHLPGALLLAVGVETVGEVPARRQVKAHDAVVGLQQTRVHFKVGGGARVGLNIDAPLLGVKAVGLQRAGLAQSLNLVNLLISAVVAGSGKTLRVFVGQRGPQALNDGPGGEVLRSNQLKGAELPVLLALDQVVQLRIVGL